MSQKKVQVILKEFEVILTRQLASYLATAIMLFDPQGTLIFYNEPAEPILGRRFEETGEILVTEMPRIWEPTDEQGAPISLDAITSRIALLECRPAHNRFWIRGLDGVRRHIEVSTFPLIGRGERFLGVITVIWEVDEERSAGARAEGRAIGLPQAASVPLSGGSPLDRGGFGATSQKEIEVILTRQLASFLAVPVFIVNPAGTLIFYNGPAELILGRRFEEMGEVPLGVWSTLFSARDETDTPLPPERLPLMAALAGRKPAHSGFWTRGLDGVRRQIEALAFPLIGPADRFLGAAALFWELQR